MLVGWEIAAPRDLPPALGATALRRGGKRFCYFASRASSRSRAALASRVWRAWGEAVL